MKSSVVFMILGGAGILISLLTSLTHDMSDYSYSESTIELLRAIVERQHVGMSLYGCLFSLNIIGIGFIIKALKDPK